MVATIPTLSSHSMVTAKLPEATAPVVVKGSSTAPGLGFTTSLHTTHSDVGGMVVVFPRVTLITQ